MTAHSLAEAYADAAHRLVGSLGVVGNLVPLLDDCAALTGGQAAGLLARGATGGLELVSATSHRAAELELYELQHETGPCVEAVQTGRVVITRTDAAPTRRTDLQREMAAAGFRTITAFPVLWHHDPIGAVNVFHTESVELTPELRRTGEAFATMAALVLAQPSSVSTEQIEVRVLEILQSRVVVEQAKGVVAYQEDVDMETAFRVVLRMAAVEGISVLDVALRIVGDAGPRT